MESVAAGESTSVDTQGGTDFAGGQPNTPAEPTVIEIANEDALIRVPGKIDKPVKFSEHVRGFQAQATKAQQERARIERELAQERALRQRYEQERQNATQRQADPNQDVFDKLKALPYLTGEEAVTMAQAIQNDLRYRDHILVGTLKELQALKKLVGGINETYSTQSFDSKINKWLTDGGYGLEWADLAKEIYLAYEGDDLDNEFPRIFADRVAQVERLVEAKRQQKVAQARKVPFVPGRGNATGPSKPLQLKGNESSKEIADLLFDSMQASGT